MHKFAFLLLLASLSGCASAPSQQAQYGNFLQNSIQANDKKLVDDVMKKLVTLYPPASTQFDLQHATPDFFGTYLIASMRAKGYAVLEFKSDKAASVVASAVAVRPAKPGLALSYIVDQAQDSDLYRVELLINSKQLDQIYQLAPDGTVYPAGYWVRKD